MKSTLQSKVAVGFVLAGLGLVFILVVQIRYLTGLLIDAAEVERTYEVTRHFDRLFSLVKDLERGHRGYLIGGDPIYLEPYYAAEEAIPQELKILERLVKDPAQDRRVLAVQPLIEQELAFSKVSIALRREKGLAAASEFFQSGKGKKIVDQIADLSAEMHQAEMQLLADRSAHERRGAWFALIASGAGVTLNLFVYSFLFFLVRREIRQRDAAEQAVRVSEERRKYFVQHSSDIIYRSGSRDHSRLPARRVGRSFGSRPGSAAVAQASGGLLRRATQKTKPEQLLLLSRQPQGRFGSLAGSERALDEAG